jgi:anti-anti-sigma factor
MLMRATFNHSGKKSIVTLEGDLTLPNAEALKGVFIKALQESDDVSLSMENVHNVDLSCLQLLCSAHRSAMCSNKHLMFQGNPPSVLRIAAEAAGYVRLKGCKVDCEGSCLWMEAAGASHE